MFLDKASIALGLAVEGLGKAGLGIAFGGGFCCQPLLCYPCLPDVMKFGVQFQNRHVFERGRL